MEDPITIVDRISRIVASSVKSMQYLNDLQLSCRENGLIYPDALDSSFAEVNRDHKCCLRKWELILNEIEKLTQQSSRPFSVNQKTRDLFNQAQEMNSQLNEKVLNLLFEFESIEDLDDLID